jgi:hypothetical protein
VKRFLAYILLCVSILLSVFVGFVPTIVSINASADYDNGQNFVYQIALKENGTKNEGDIESGSAIESITNTFKSRLDKANISTYKLEVEGNTTIRLSFKAQKEINSAIAKYLNFDWNLEAMDYSGNILLESADFFTSGSAYIDYTSSYPVIVMPLANAEDFKTKLYKNVSGTTTTKDDGTNSVNNNILGNYEVMADDTTTTTKNENYIYLVNNWDTTAYSMDTVINDSASADTKEANAYIDRIDATKPENVYFDYDSTKTDATFTKLKYTGFLSNAGSDLNLANKLATIVCSQLNSEKLDYNVTLINKDIINDATNNTVPFIEKIIYHGDTYGSYSSIVFSSLLISCLVAIVVVSLFLILNYGLSALTSMSLIPAVLLVTLAIFNSFGAEFNIGTIIALISVAIVLLFSQLPYFKGVKEELYKGKNLRKANEETSKRVLPLQFDISFITILFGLVAYLIPNSIMISVGATLILGGLFNIVASGLLLRGIYYFLTNSSFISSHLNLLMVESKKIPNLANDEKPTYFESFKKKQNTKTNKIYGAAGLLMLIASIIGICAFQFGTGNIYNSNSSAPTSTRVYIQFTYNENSSIQSVSDLETKVLDHLYTYNTSTNTTNSSTNVPYKDVLSYTYSYKENYKNNKETLKNIYYVVQLNSSYTKDSLVSAYVDSKYNLEGTNIEDAIQYLLLNYNSVSNFTSVELKSVTNVNDDTNNYYTMLFALIGSAIASLYLILRYGISRGLTSLLLVGGSLVITVGIFVLVRGSFTSQITLGLIIVAIYGYSLITYLFNNERNFIKDSRIDKADFEGRKNNSIYALNTTYSNAFIVAALSEFTVISFLFASTFSSYFIILVVIGFLLATATMRFLEVDLSYILIKFFGNIGNRIAANYNARRLAKAQKKNIVDKGDGPEEATFIGIND